MISADQLALCTGASLQVAQTWLGPLTAAMDVFGITTPVRMAPFLANVGHESARLTRVREIWGPTPAQVRYEGREDLGNVRPGDGRRFLGRGPLQVTGRRNCIATRDNLRKYLPNVPDFEASPELLELPRWGAYSAGLYWMSHGLNELADAGDFDAICDRINIGHETAAEGDSNGYAERLKLYIAGKAALGIA